MRRGLVVACLVLVLLPACTDPVIDEIVFHGYPIIGGEPDLRLSHAGVVAIFNGPYGCSGTLIAPRVVLTAAHCVEEYDAKNFLVLFGDDTGSAMTRVVEETSVHPSYVSNGDQAAPFDLGLLLLTSGAPPGVTPLPVLPPLLEITEDDIGTPVEFVGFGQDEQGRTGVKLAATNNIEYVCTDPGGCPYGMYMALQNTFCQDQSPGGICFGDSGGPALIVRDSKEYVAGVSSYVFQDCLYFGCSTKVDVYTGYIEDFVAGRPGSECDQDEDCRTGSCSDGVCCEDECQDPCYSCAIPGSLGTCRSVPDGTPCPDGDRCNGDEVCQDSQCQPGTQLTCNDGNVCTTDVCNAASGCVFRQVVNGTPCDNEDMCDGRETCEWGYCSAGTVPDCDDQDPCTQDACDPGAGCVHQAAADGTPCGDGTCGASACQEGQCQETDVADCSDGDPCTRDECDPETGCKNEPWPDGMKCGECMVCKDRQCVDDPDCAETGGCGCASPGPRAHGWLGLAWLVAWLFGSGLYRKPGIC
jgi:hypothetical protein